MLTRQAETDHRIFDLIRDIARMMRCLRQDEIFCEGVTFAQFLALEEVGRRERLPLGELHRALDVDKSTTTRLVKPLLAGGLVVRQKALHDGRAVELALTGRGREVRARVWSCLCEFTRAVGSNLPRGRQDDVLDAVRLFLGALQRTQAAKACAAGSCSMEGTDDG